MNHSFSAIPSTDIQRSTFDRSHGYKTAFDGGYLVPFFCEEVLPADTLKLNVSLFGRLSTPIVPFMDNLYLETFFFFVPNRLIWENWQRFNGEQDNPSDTTDYLIPTLPDNTTIEEESIGDYFGLPTGVPLNNVNALPFRAYNLIYNEWFRDENLQDSLVVNKGDGPDSMSNYSLVRRGKRHDYFTSALPWPQKGPGVDIGLTGNAEMILNGTVPYTGVINQSQISAKSSGNNDYGSLYTTTTASFGSGTSAVYSIGLQNANTSSDLKNRRISNFSSAMTGSLIFDNASAGTLELAQIASVTINNLRQAFQLQRLYERDARGGTRYTEILRSHFGVISPDARLQRPEYLGGSSTRININPVQQTSSTDAVTPQGNLAAYGVLGDNSRICNKSFVEHGYIIGLVNVRADLTYQQGLNKMWSRRTRFDFYWPSLAHLGEQAVLNKEIYAQGTDEDDEVFGYQERYAEYRYKPNQITGKLRSTSATSLDVWHLAQKFENLPVLNSEFIVDNPPLDRVLAVTDEPEILLDCWFGMKSTRPMPLFGVPGLIDHF